MEYPKVGIILINYKDYARKFLGDCRDSMRVLDYPRDKYSVYIVDNATSPETRAYLREIWPEAVVIPNAENSGWGGGNNLGIERAWVDGCQDVVLSNMDVLVEKGWLKELVEKAYSGDDNQSLALSRPTKLSFEPIGIVQSKLLLHPVGSDGVQRINSLGNQIHFLGFGYCRGYGEPDSPLAIHDTRYTIHDIPYASGASMYVKGEVLKKIGLCNPEFFMYHDDMELCLKAKLAGYRVVLAPKSIMWHKYEFRRSIMQVYYMERNRLLAMLEFYKWPTLILLAPAFFVMELGVLAGAIVGKYARPKLRSWGYFFKPSSWKKLLVERKKIQALRTISDRELTRDFTGQILFQEIMNPLLKYVANPALNWYWTVARKMIFW